MPNLPATIDKAHATLPEKYEAARSALAECSRVDECKEWKDKAAALASYAKQADDDELYVMARKIQGRAVRRCGELMAEFQTGEKGGRPAGKNGGRATPVSQRSAAEAAGLSKDQEKQARRVASIPEDEFEALIEREGGPPTVSELAERGKKVKPEEPKPAGFLEATYLVGALDRLLERTKEATPVLIANGLRDWERKEVVTKAKEARDWLGRLISQLEKLS